MRKRPRITEEQEHIIARVAKQFRSSAFGPHTPEDCEQIAWTIALQMLPKWDPSRGKLENFLRLAISCRLTNLKKEFCYFRSDWGHTPQHPKGKIQITNCSQLSAIIHPQKIVKPDNTPVWKGAPSTPAAGACSDPLEILAAKETLEVIRAGLTDEERDQLDRLLARENVEYRALRELRKKIAKMLKQRERDGKA